MLLGFHEAIKLKTKKIMYVIEGNYIYDPHAVNQLKVLIDRRRAIEESINNKRTAPEITINEYLARGPSSQSQQDLQKLEEYLPLLSHLVLYSENLSLSPTNFIGCMPQLTVQWSSALTSSCCIKIGGSKYFHVKNLRFELGMSHFLYGAVLRERAFETMSTDLKESAALFRRAAGVYSYLAEKVLPPLKHHLPMESPVEAAPSLSSIMSLICLADAQAVSIKKAQENGTKPSLLSKLHYGIIQILDEATSIITSKPGDLSDLSPKLKDFLSTCSVLHELRSQKYQAEDLRGNEQIGVAISFLQHAMSNAKKVKTPKNESYSSVLSKEVKDLGEMLKKFEHENEFVWQVKVPSINMSLTLEGKRIFSSITYEPKQWDRTESS